MTVLTQRQHETFVRRIKKHETAIATQREALRNLISDIEAVADDADDAIESLRYAADALSRLL
jgi:DNA-binding ferritin-like protein